MEVEKHVDHARLALSPFPISLSPSLSLSHLHQVDVQVQRLAQAHFVGLGGRVGGAERGEQGA